MGSAGLFTSCSGLGPYLDPLAYGSAPAVTGNTVSLTETQGGLFYLLPQAERSKAREKPGLEQRTT